MQSNCKVVILIVWTYLSTCLVQAKNYERCELWNVFQKYFPPEQVNTCKIFNFIVLCSKTIKEWNHCNTLRLSHFRTIVRIFWYSISDIRVLVRNFNLWHPKSNLGYKVGTKEGTLHIQTPLSLKVRGLHFIIFKNLLVPWNTRHPC